MKALILLTLLLALFVPQAAIAAEPEIGWIPTWQQAVAEAKQTYKPILLVAAAPQCGGVPGVW